MNFFLMLVFLTSFVSCKKEEPIYTKEQLYNLAREHDSNMSFILPKSMQDGIKCESYTEGCQSGHIVKIRGVELIAVEFLTHQQAKEAANKYRGYHLRNWMFDDVTGEPLLEDFMKLIEAKKFREDSFKK
jgi:hypothetical protein